MSSHWRLDDFESVIEAVFQKEPKAVLIGGQACNFYSLHYIEKDKALEEFRPFTSHDIDIYTPDDSVADTAAKKLQAKLEKAPRRNPSPVKAAMTLTGSEGDELLVQFMAGAYGVGTDDLVESAIEYPIFGFRILVMHPVYLLQSKLHCLKGLNQEDRQDKKHANRRRNFYSVKVEI